MNLPEAEVFAREVEVICSSEVTGSRSGEERNIPGDVSCCDNAGYEVKVPATRDQGPGQKNGCHFSESEIISGTKVESDDIISRFIHDFIVGSGYPAVYQNQMISAIKNHYLMSGRGKIGREFPDRPHRVRSLPKVFPSDEVGRILNAPVSLMHKVILGAT